MTTLKMPSTVSAEMQQCIAECLSCHAVCVATVQYCLSQGGKHAETGHIRTMLDCAQACITSADFMLRGSELHTRTCGVCAEACERCADSCAAMGDDQTMQQCAEACRRCAESCRKMAAMA